jgi:transposase
MPEPACPECARLRRRVAELEALVRGLEVTVRDLQARLGANATNSSLPPSANPPQAPKPVVKEPTGQKPGGQPGHPGPLRLRLPPERLKEVVRHVPAACARCQAPLPAEPQPGDPAPTWHQVAELPPTLAEVTEHQGHGRTCPCCGTVTWAKVPDDVRAHAFGPRLTAAVAYLRGSPHVSQRGLEEMVEELFGVPISLGTITNLEQEASAALAPAHAEAQKAVQDAPAKHVDETGWKQAGKRCWLWAAATKLVACFVIHPSRGAVALAALLGRKIKGLVTSDRWSAYNQLPPERRQVCWAHLKRDFQKLVDRGGPAKELGETGLEITWVVFDLWHAFLGGGLSRRGLQEEMAFWREALRDELERGRACADGKAATFCANLLALGPALWTFVDRPGVEPTNNHAERILRSGVLWRKGSFGCHSEQGCRFVERVLTVVQTLRLQKRRALQFLYQALLAHRQGSPAPKLLPTV